MCKDEAAASVRPRAQDDTTKSAVAPAGKAASPSPKPTTALAQASTGATPPSQPQNSTNGAARIAAATATLVEAGLGTIVSGTTGLTMNLQSAQTHDAMVRLDTIGNENPELREDAQRLLAVLKANSKADNATTTSALAAASGVLGSLRLAVPSPFSAAFGALSVVCGLAVTVRANRAACCNLAERIVSLHPIILAIYRQQKPPNASCDPMQAKIIERMVSVCNTACELMRKFAPEEEADDEDDGGDGSRRERWVGARFAAWAKQKFTQVIYCPADFDLIHQQLDRVLHDYNFSALVKVTSVQPAPDSIAIEAMLKRDAETLKRDLDQTIQSALAQSNAAARTEILHLQDNLSSVFGDKLNRMSGTLDAIYRLLTSKEFEKLEVDESRVRLSRTPEEGEVLVDALLDEHPVVARRSIAADENEARNVLHEAQLLAQLYHPNIVRCFGVVFKEQRTYLLLEHCAAPLERVLQAHGALPPNVAAIALMKISGALRTLHSRNRVHRQVSVSRIWVKDGGELCLANLGAATLATGTRDDGGSDSAAEDPFQNDDVSRADEQDDDLARAPPEILRSRLGVRLGASLRSSTNGSASNGSPTFRPTKKADVYSLAMLAQQLFSGATDPWKSHPTCASLPSHDLIFRIVNSNARPEVPASTPPAIADLMLACWKDNPDERPTMDEVYSQLTAYVKKESGGDGSGSNWSNTWQEYMAQVLGMGLPPFALSSTAAGNSAGKSSSSVGAAKPTLVNVAARFHRATRGASQGQATLTPSEAVELLRSCGIADLSVNEMKLFTRASTGQQEVVTAPVFCAFFAARVKESFEEVLGISSSSVAAQIPPLDAEKLLCILDSVGLKNKVSAKEAQKLIKLADVNGDSTIELNELLLMVDSLMEEDSSGEASAGGKTSAVTTNLTTASVTSSDQEQPPSAAGAQVPVAVVVACDVCGDETCLALHTRIASSLHITTPNPVGGGAAATISTSVGTLECEQVCAACLADTTTLWLRPPVSLSPSTFPPHAFLGIGSWTPEWLALLPHLSAKHLALDARQLERGGEGIVVVQALPILPDDVRSVLANVESLVLRNATDRTCQLLLGAAPRLKKLLIPCATIGDQGARTLSTFTTVTHLDVSGCSRLSDTGLSKLSALGSSLLHLSVADCGNVTAAGLRQLVANVPRLRTLNLCCLARLDDSALQKLVLLQDLRKIHLGGCNLVSNATLQHLSILQNLEMLVLNGCDRITDAGLRLLSSSTTSRLTTLLLEGQCEVSDDGLGALRALTTLRRLSAVRCNQVLGLSVPGGLRQLCLSGCTQVQDTAFVSIRGLMSASLTSLDLSRSDVSDQGVDVIRALPLLVQLSLMQCPRLTDASLVAIGQFAKQLRVLRFTDNKKVTGSGASSLATLPQLVELTLSRCPQITTDAVNLIVFGGAASRDTLRIVDLSGCRMDQTLLQRPTSTASQNASATATTPPVALSVLRLSRCGEICANPRGALENILQSRTGSMLRCLDLSQSVAAGDDVVSALSVVECPRIQQLLLSQSTLSDAVRPLWASLATLTQLDASYTSISDVTVAEGFAQLINLQSLCLAGCSVTNRGLALLKSLRTSLRELDLNYCDGVGDKGLLDYLGDVKTGEGRMTSSSRQSSSDDSGLCTLRRLSVAYSGCTDAFLRGAMQRAPVLLSLDVSGCSGITDQGVMALLPMPDAPAFGFWPDPVSAAAAAAAVTKSPAAFSLSLRTLTLNQLDAVTDRSVAALTSAYPLLKVDTAGCRNVISRPLVV